MTCHILLGMLILIVAWDDYPALSVLSPDRIIYNSVGMDWLIRCNMQCMPHTTFVCVSKTFSATIVKCIFNGMEIPNVIICEVSAISRHFENIWVLTLPDIWSFIYRGNEYSSWVCRWTRSSTESSKHTECSNNCHYTKFTSFTSSKLTVFFGQLYFKNHSVQFFFNKMSFLSAPYIFPFP